MISETGTSIRRTNRLNDKGYTFVEVMLSIVIFSVGIVGIYRSFIVSLDRLSSLNNRFHANLTLDNEMTNLERTLRSRNALPIDLNPQTTVETGAKTLNFHKSVNLGQLSELSDIFSVGLSFTWEERGRSIRLGRAGYLTNFKDE